MALNTQDEENADSFLISSDTDMENEPLNVGSSIDRSHLLNCEEQHNNNKGHVTSDQETAHISEKPQITTTNLKPELLSSTLSLKVHATIIQLQRPLWIQFYNLLLLQDTFTMFHRLKMESTLIFDSELSAFSAKTKLFQ